MEDAERAGLKDNLRAMIAGRGDGIDIDTPFQWIVEDLRSPEPFFENLGLLIPQDAILYFEGCTIAPEAVSFYEAHPAQNAVAVVRDTLFPTPETFHVRFVPAVTTQLLRLLAEHGREKLFDHVKAYKGESLLFTFHDAFEGWLMISDKVPESVITAFCQKLGVKSRREPTPKRDTKAIQALLYAMENPGKVRICGETWWKRTWRRLTTRGK